jgi:urea transporter
VGALTARARVSAALDAGLRTYAGLVFARARVSGALLALATLADPAAAAGGAAAVAIALGAARALGFGKAQPALFGVIGCNALLVGLGVAHAFAPSVETFALLAVAALVTTLAAAALTSLLARLALPVLALAFVLVLPLATATALHAGLPLRMEVSGPPPLAAAALDQALSAFGAVLFLPRWDVGACVLAALLVHSRAACVHAAAGLVVVSAGFALTPVPVDPGIVSVALLNAWLTAVALGVVWFVPSGASLALGAAGALVSALLAAGLSGTAARLGLPLLIAPFFAASSLVLLAMRQRAEDEHPKSVDFEPGTPEENLRYHRTRRARFASLHPVAFALPFRGRWTCTQAVDGPHTHQGPWRFAFDFEVRAEDGSFARDGGLSPEDHHCYGLPVLAAAAGTVIAVEASVPDVRVGEVDLARNWGNHVLVAHGASLYSLVAHLAPGSVRVVPGQVVTRGEPLGACGGSGRAPRPHLHFQLQSGPELGAPTVPCRFVDAVSAEDPRLASAPAAEERLARELVPAEGDVVRPVSRDDALASVFAWPLGTTLAFDVDGAREDLEATVSLLGQRTLTSSSGASLPYDVGPFGFLAYDAQGDARSVVHLLRLALPRLPFDAGAGAALSFADLVPERAHLGPVLHALFDLALPFVDRAGLDMSYRVRREGARVVVTGASASRDALGAPRLATRAEIDTDGVRAVEVRRGRRVRSARRRSRGAPRVSPSPIQQTDARSVTPFERSRETWTGGRA